MGKTKQQHKSMYITPQMRLDLKEKCQKIEDLFNKVENELITKRDDEVDLKNISFYQGKLQTNFAELEQFLKIYEE